MESESSFHTKCPLTVLLKAFPELDEVLELFYRCRLCAASQVYVDALAFYDHVQGHLACCDSDVISELLLSHETGGASRQFDTDFQEFDNACQELHNEGHTENVEVVREKEHAYEISPPVNNNNQKQHIDNGSHRLDYRSQQIDNFSQMDDSEEKSDYLTQEVDKERTIDNFSQQLDNDEVIDNFKQEFDNEEGQIDNFGQQVDNDEEQIDNFSQQVDNEEEQIDNFGPQVDNEEEQIDNFGQQVDSGQEQMDNLREEADEEEEHIDNTNQETESQEAGMAHDAGVVNVRLGQTDRLDGQVEQEEDRDGTGEISGQEYKWSGDENSCTDRMLLEVKAEGSCVDGGEIGSGSLLDVKGCGDEPYKSESTPLHITRSPCPARDIQGLPCQGKATELEDCARGRNKHVFGDTCSSSWLCSCTTSPECKEERLHACRYCNNKFMTSSEVARHLVTDCAIAKHKCPHCHQKIKPRSRLLRHINSCAKNQRIIECYKCNKQFKRMANLTKHSKKDCSVTSFPCRVCFKEFHSMSDRNVHEQRHTESRATCDVCFNSYSTKAELKRHQRMHTQDNLMQCEVCGKAFNKKYNFERHMLYHSGVKPFKCEQCGKAFTTQHYLGEHLLVHQDAQPFKCMQCGESFRSKYLLCQHEIIHKGLSAVRTAVLCDVCGKAFYSRSQLTLHYRSHSGEKPFTCDVCHRAFSCKSSLVKHGEIHAGLREHVCQHCGKTFYSNKNLKHHISSHLGGKPLSGPIAFSGKDTLEAHENVLINSFQPLYVQVIRQKQNS